MQWLWFHFTAYKVAVTFSLFEKSIKVQCSILRDVFRLVSQDFSGQSLQDGTKTSRDPQVSVGERH